MKKFPKLNKINTKEIDDESVGEALKMVKIDVYLNGARIQKTSEKIMLKLMK